MPLESSYKGRLMITIEKLLIGWMAVLLSFALLCGCGEVSESPPDLNRLKILELYPLDGEEGVPQAMSAIVVFNDSVNFDTGAANVNGSTFYLEESEGGTVGGLTVEPSNLDTQEATGLIVLPDPSPLQSGSSYYVVVEATIKGKNTDPLGTQVRNEFTVQ
jgi:hypothetical protein